MMTKSLTSLLLGSYPIYVTILLFLSEYCIDTTILLLADYHIVLYRFALLLFVFGPLLACHINLFKCNSTQIYQLLIPNYYLVITLVIILYIILYYL